MKQPYARREIIFRTPITAARATYAVPGKSIGRRERYYAMDAGIITNVYTFGVQTGILSAFEMSFVDRN